MAELDFERGLERLFAQTPDYSDSEAFAGLVENRLDRGWNLRRMLIGAAGVAGGVVGASQLIMSNFLHRVEDASEGSSKLLAAGFAQVKPSLDLFASAQSDWLVICLASGMAILAIGFVLTKVIEEI